MEDFVEALDSEKSYFVETDRLAFLFHWVNGQFYLRKVESRDPRYCRVVAIDDESRYALEDLDLGTIFSYMHPRLLRAVKAGPILRVNVR